VWAARHRVEHHALEQSKEWQDLTNEAIAIAGGQSTLTFSSVVDLGNKRIRYAAAIPKEADLIYLDGPSSRGTAYPLSEPTPIGFDVPDHLASGARPRTILVDGKASSCIYLIEHGLVSDYLFFPQYSLAVDLQHPDATHMHRHTAFLFTLDQPTAM
jgi:hypothetical protein